MQLGAKPYLSRLKDAGPRVAEDTKVDHDEFKLQCFVDTVHARVIQGHYFNLNPFFGICLDRLPSLAR